MASEQKLSATDWRQLLAFWQRGTAAERAVLREEAAQRANLWRERVYGRRIFLRALLEISNICENNCLYCGIRAGNKAAERYRLSLDELTASAEAAYERGFRTFVLQGGQQAEDRERLLPLLRNLRGRFPDAALTLSLGEHPTAAYRAWREAGADRYLLRHETALAEHYAMLHPEGSLAARLACLTALQELGYQIGCGMMIGSPGQTPEALVADFLLLQRVQPQMVGIGPFIPHVQTPLAHESAGSAEDCLFYLSLIRLLLPSVLLPATTALNTILPEGRFLGLAAGANVLMLNCTPQRVREAYSLYDHQAKQGREGFEAYEVLAAELAQRGYEVGPWRGDWQPIPPAVDGSRQSADGTVGSC